LADFLRENGGKIVSILTAEYNEDVAKRIFGRDLLEKVAVNLLKQGHPVSSISEATGISSDKILELKNTLSASGSELLSLGIDEE